MEPAVMWIDKHDEELVALANVHSDLVVDSTPLAAELALAVATLTTLASTVNLVTAAINSNVARSTNVIKIGGRKYELTPENKEKIMAAIDEHFKS